MRMGLFGGTFDPIHLGHIRAALAAADACTLDRVLVIPSGMPPHKSNLRHAAYSHRFRMVELACAVDPRLEASRLEAPESADRPHFTVETVDRVCATMTFDPPLRFIIGADAYADLGIWRDVDRVIAAVEFLVVGRPGCQALSSTLGGLPRARFIECSHPASSSAVRRRARMDHPLDDLVPAAVSDYIRECSLYRN